MTGKLTVAVAVSPSPSVTVKVADAAPGADHRAVRRERVRPVRLHLDRAGADVDRLRVVAVARLNTSAVPLMCVTVAPSAPGTKSSVPVTVAPSATFCERLVRRRRRIVVEGDGQRAGGGRAVRIGDRVGQAVVGRSFSSFGPVACSTLSSSVTV